MAFNNFAFRAVPETDHDARAEAKRMAEEVHAAIDAGRITVRRFEGADVAAACVSREIAERERSSGRAKRANRNAAQSKAAARMKKGIAA